MSATTTAEAGAPATAVPTAEASAESALQAAVRDAFARGEASGLAKAQATASAATKPNYADVVAAWINASVNNTPVAQNAEGYSHLTTVALPDLIKRLAAA
jgi:hypothetical protein